MDLRAAGGPDLVHAIPACHARRVRVGAVVRRRRQQRTGVHLDRSGWRSLRVDFGARRSVERPDRDLLPIRLAVRCRRRRRKHRDIDRPHRWGWRLAARRLRWGQRPHGSHRDFMCLRNAVRRGRPQRQRVQFHQPAGGVSAWTDPVAADISGECAIRFCGPPVSSPIGLVPRADPALACPSTSLCALVDRFGAVVTTSDPTGGAGNWTRAAFGSVNLFSVSCTSASFCVAADTTGDGFTSTDPTGRSDSWSTAQIDPGRSVTGFSCAAAPLCLAVDRDGGVVSSTDPGAGTATWSRVGVNPDGLQMVSCASGSLCVALGPLGATVTNPTGTVVKWLHQSDRGFKRVEANRPEGHLPDRAHVPFPVAVHRVRRQRRDRERDRQLHQPHRRHRGVEAVEALRALQHHLGLVPVHLALRRNRYGWAHSHLDGSRRRRRDVEACDSRRGCGTSQSLARIGFVPVGVAVFRRRDLWGL